MTPWLSSHSRRLSEASSITVAPLRLAGWTASDPALPVAPDTTTTSRADVPTPLTGCQPSVPGYRVRPPQLGHRAFRSLWSELRPGRPPAARPNGWKPAASRSPNSGTRQPISPSAAAPDTEVCVPASTLVVAGQMSATLRNGVMR